VRESRPVEALAEGFYLLPFVVELAVEAAEAFDSGPTPLARLLLVIGVAFESDAILSGTEFQFDSPELAVAVTRGVVVLTRSFIISLNVSNQPDIFETGRLAVPVIDLELSLEALLELVYGVDIETGETKWQADESVLPAAYVKYLGSYDGDVCLGTTEGIQVLASETGEPIATHDSWYIGTSRLESLGEIHGETPFAAVVETLDAHPLGDNGASWSKSDLGRVYTTPVVDNSLIVVGTQEGDVYAFERDSGETRWEASITNSVAAIATTGSHVWVGDTDIGLTAYDRETGSLVHRSTKPVRGDDIAVADDVLLLGGDTATAYTIE
jgi:hypothetical protein